MKRQHLLYMAAAGLLLSAGCGQGAGPDKTKEAKQAALEASAKQHCYQARDEQDEALMQLKTYNDGAVRGSLVINYAEKGKNDGTIEGKYSGDTLFVDYTFKIGTENPTVYKNPLAFLKQGDSLILGVGVIETYLGKSYLVKDKPIRFDQSKFTFKPGNCP